MNVAYLTGVKGNYGTIGVSAKVKRKSCDAKREKLFHTESIAKWALNAGKSIGLVTTTRGMLKQIDTENSETYASKVNVPL